MNIDNQLRDILEFYANNRRYKSWSALNEAVIRIKKLFNQTKTPKSIGVKDAIK